MLEGQKGQIPRILMQGRRSSSLHPGAAGRFLPIYLAGSSHGIQKGGVQLLHIDLHGVQKTAGRAFHVFEHGNQDVLGSGLLLVEPGCLLLRIIKHLFRPWRKAAALPQGHAALRGNKLSYQLLHCAFLYFSLCQKLCRRAGVFPEQRNQDMLRSHIALSALCGHLFRLLQHMGRFVRIIFKHILSLPSVCYRNCKVRRGFRAPPSFLLSFHYKFRSSRSRISMSRSSSASVGSSAFGSSAFGFFVFFGSSAASSRALRSIFGRLAVRLRSSSS